MIPPLAEWKMAEGVSFFRKMQRELTRSFYLTIMGISFRKLIADRTMPDLQGSESLNVMFRIFTSFFAVMHRKEASEKSGKMTKGGRSWKNFWEWHLFQPDSGGYPEAVPWDCWPDQGRKFCRRIISLPVNGGNTRLIWNLQIGRVFFGFLW